MGLVFGKVQLTALLYLINFEQVLLRGCQRGE